MRRSAVLLAFPLIALAAGCSAADDTTAAGAGATPAVGASSAAGVTKVDPSVAAAADKALSGNTKAICDQAARTSTSFGEAFIADLQLQIDAASKGAQAKAEAQEKINRDVASYSSALSGMAKLADDKTLKSVLTAMSKQVNALKGDIAKINQGKLSTISGNLDKACGKS